VKDEHAEAQEQTQLQSPSAPGGCWSAPAGNRCGAWAWLRSASAVCAGAFLPAQTDSPHAGVHQVHAQQAGNQEVDVARAGFAGGCVDVLIASLRPAADWSGVDFGAGKNALRTRGIVIVRVAAVRIRLDRQIVLAEVEGLERGLAVKNSSANGGFLVGSRFIRTGAVCSIASVFCAPAPSITTTEVTSAGLLRKAMPNPAASSSGKMKTQNTTSGSRLSSSMRAQSR
jgi:hypothetical protein